jgi:hypothetical protein
MSSMEWGELREGLNGFVPGRAGSASRFGLGRYGHGHADPSRQ